MHKFHRIFYRDDMIAFGFIDAVEHGCQRCRFSTACWSSYQHQSLFHLHQSLELRRQSQFFHAENLLGNDTKRCAQSLLLLEKIDPKSAHPVEMVTKIRLSRALKAVPVIFRNDGSDEIFKIS